MAAADGPIALGADANDELEKGKAYLRVYALLIEAARFRGTVTYSDIARIMGLPERGSWMGKMTGRMLGSISVRERSCGRPMISAVAVSSTNRQPGFGFFVLAEQFGEIAPDLGAQERIAFWEAERDRVYAEWSD